MRRVRILGVWLGLLVLSLELLVRVVVLAKGEVAPAPDESLQHEWEWADRHLAAARPVFESTLAPDQTLGWRNAAGLREPGLTTNEDGWRSTREFVREKPPGTRRLVLVGDSYTFGHAAADDEIFAALVEERLAPEWEVLNFAVSGYGTDQQVLCYETVAREYAPDAVVLGFFLRDYARNLLDFRTYAKPRFELDGDGLRLVGVPVDPPTVLYARYERGERVVGGSVLRSWFVDLARAKWREHRARRVDEGSTGWRLVARMQERFRAGVVADGAVPLWLQIPTEGVVAGEASHYATINALCREHAGRIGLSCLDLAPLLRAHDAAHPDDPFHNPADRGGHLSPAGHRVVADALVAWILERWPAGGSLATGAASRDG